MYFSLQFTFLRTIHSSRLKVQQCFHILKSLNRTAYANVAGKYQDVLALEQSVAELHQLFQDFALLTDQQGELLDQIEFNVKEAADHVEDANVEVYESIELQKSIRKKQWYVYHSFYILFYTLSNYNSI